MDDRQILNTFFVRTFIKIEHCEERAMAAVDSNVSLSEVHTLAAVSVLTLEARNTVTNIAKMEALTPGSVSVAVNTLVKKGYLCRKTTDKDRRKVYIYLTDRANGIVHAHKRFHTHMIDAIANTLSESELRMLARSLVSLGEFYDNLPNL